MAAIAAIIAIPILWSWHSHSLLSARTIGRGDVRAAMCQQHPKIAQTLMPPDSDGTPSTCKDFEHHFEDHP